MQLMQPINWTDEYISEMPIVIKAKFGTQQQTFAVCYKTP